MKISILMKSNNEQKIIEHDKFNQKAKPLE